MSKVPSITLNDHHTKPAPSSPIILRHPKARKKIPSTVSEQLAGGKSFQGLVTDIPSGELEDPFSSDQLEFSKRGSVLWRGSKYCEPNTSIGHPPEIKSSIFSGVFGSDGKSTRKESYEMLPRPQSAQEIVVHGRIDNHSLERPISAEEHRLSQRVRTWYGQQDKILGYGLKMPDTKLSSNIPDSEDADLVMDLPGRPSHRLDPTDGRLKAPRMAGAIGDRMSVPNTTAGGIEDWTDLDSKDVDRYGFYSSRTLGSKRLSAAALSASGSTEQQRITHSRLKLTAATDQSHPQSQQTTSPNASQAGTANRLSLSAGGKPLRTSPSLLTSRSKRSTTSMAFRPISKGRRHIDEASTMLNPLHGLEHEDFMQESRFVTGSDTNRTLERKRAVKWARMSKPVTTTTSRQGGGTDFHFNTSHSKVVSRTWKGIPDCWRGAAWYSFLDTSARQRSSSGAPEPSDAALELFFNNCQSEDCVDDAQIDMDVPRTVGAHVGFRQRYRGGQRFLFRVLRALSLYFPETGYVQGMASIVATLLNYYTEERAFVMSVRMWTLRGIGWLYREGFGGLMTALSDLENHWMRASAVSKQLDQLGISITGWGPKWYLTLFNYVLPFPAQLRVWDVFMLLGDPNNSAPHPMSNPDCPRPASEKQVERTGSLAPPPNLDVLHATATAILSALHDTIVDADFENVMKVLTIPVPVSNEDVLMTVAKREWMAKQTLGR